MDFKTKGVLSLLLLCTIFCEVSARSRPPPIPYPEQLKWKRNVTDEDIAEVLERLDLTSEEALQPPVPPCEGCPPPSCSKSRRAGLKFKYPQRDVIRRAVPNVDDWEDCCRLCIPLPECNSWVHNGGNSRCILLRSQNYKTVADSGFSCGNFV